MRQLELPRKNTTGRVHSIFVRATSIITLVEVKDTQEYTIIKRNNTLW